jgi:hemoglobin
MVTSRIHKTWRAGGWSRWLICMGFAAALGLVTGCGGGTTQKQNRNFFTSGSREADQRASQRMAKAEQLSGSGEGSGEKEKKGKGARGGSGDATAVAPEKTSLFDRLGGEQGIDAIIEDFLPRVLQDPRVDWERKTVKRGGLFHHGPPVAWNPTPGNVEALKKHMAQFLSLATGGPPHYDGKEIKSAHAGMNIANPEFDAAVGDLKASLDKLKIANQEQKELLAIVESTRPQIVVER